MKDYKAITAFSKKCQRISASVLDEFLLSYAISQKKLGRRMDRTSRKYKHILRDLQSGLPEMIITQLIAYNLFRENGMIRSLLNHRTVKDRPPEEYEYLQFMADLPWRFSFSTIKDNPEKSFYQMVDAFSGEEFLLYSEGITTLLKKETPLLWLNLIGYNGQCWQTFGPLLYFKGFTTDDIFFFATERNPDIENDTDLVKNLEKNPLPYQLLISGANYPITFHGSHELVLNSSQLETEHFRPDQLQEDFEIQQHQSVYRLQLKNWHKLPHFSTVYYDKKNHLLSLNAMTDAGYSALIEHLNKYQISVDPVADIRVHPAMIKTAQDILKKDIPIDPYAEFFSN